jgi:hypothetical protein
MEPKTKTGVVISIDRTQRKGCIRVPEDFDHEFSLLDAPRHIKRDWSVKFLSIPTEQPDKPKAVQVRSCPRPAA